ncbi:DUF4846 domain-containing protein [Nannocystaceae bacterium ST9]
MRRLAASIVFALALACGPADTSVDLEPEPIDPRAYAWVADAREVPASTSLATRFPTPSGYARVEVDARSFAGWLRGLPVRIDRRAVHDHRGRATGWDAAGVITLDVGDKNLQQCADSLLRLHGEWLWSQGRPRELAYHFTSGDLSRFEDWVAGRRWKVEGAKVKQVEVEPVARDRAALRAWFEQLFMYAGTRSLELDTEPVPLDRPIEAGDLLLRPGSPGHVVMVLDVAEGAERERIAVIGQGSMPAQELHVIPGPLAGAWFRFPAGEDVEVDVPGWGALPRSSLRRFRTR